MADRPIEAEFRNPKTRTPLFMALRIGTLESLALGTKLREIGQAEGLTSARGRAA